MDFCVAQFWFCPILYMKRLRTMHYLINSLHIQFTELIDGEHNPLSQHGSSDMKLEIVTVRDDGGECLPRLRPRSRHQFSPLSLSRRKNFFNLCFLFLAELFKKI